MPCRNCGAGGVGIAGLSGPYLSTPDRRFRADSDFCLRWTFAAQSRQYFARPERVRKPLPQTSQRCSCLGLKMPRSSFGCSGSTAWRNQRQIRLRETACGKQPAGRRRPAAGSRPAKSCSSVLRVPARCVPVPASDGKAFRPAGARWGQIWPSVSSFAISFASDGVSVVSLQNVFIEPPVPSIPSGVLIGLMDDSLVS